MSSYNNPSTTSRQRGKKEIRAQKTDGTLYDHGNTVSKNPVSASTPSSATTASKTSSILQIWAPTLVLIFGGCCSNVYTLESLIQTSPSSGPLITAFQFLLVALATLPHHLSLSRGWRNLYLRERAIPLRKWLIYTAYFLSVNILNNMAFNYRISIPLHIILRSAGPVATMGVGRIWGGKRYPPRKIVAVLLLFVGVVLAAFADTWSKQADVEYHSADRERPSSAVSSAGISSQAPGFALLASALLLSACMGLYTDDMYATHGRAGSITAETLFYSHAISLPYFASQAKPLMQEFANVTALAVSSFDSTSTAGFKSSWPNDADIENSTSAVAPWTKLLPFVAPSLLSSPSSLLPISMNLDMITNIQIPRPVLLLLLNATTQLLCIVGVNRLSAQSSSLTVSIVLNIRKLASLVLSIFLFGNTLPTGVMIGAAVVFVGGGLYALPASPAPSKAVAPRTKAKNVTDKKTK